MLGQLETLGDAGSFRNREKSSVAPHLRVVADAAPAKSAAPEDFSDALVELIPFMRACARAMTPDRNEADDVVQEALLKAWAKRDSFRPGTSMKAWTATIVRNHFRQTRRRSWRQCPLDQEVAEQTLVAIDDPSASLHLDDVRRALYALPLIHREVLMLLAGGLSYEEVADICGCPEGTVKSRASRGRAALHALVDDGRPPMDDIRASDAADVLMREMRMAASA